MTRMLMRFRTRVKIKNIESFLVITVIIFFSNDFINKIIYPNYIRCLYLTTKIWYTYLLLCYLRKHDTSAHEISYED